MTVYIFRKVNAFLWFSNTFKEYLYLRYSVFGERNLEEKTITELFDIELQWSTNNSLPAYLTLVCGLFYSTER